MSLINCKVQLKLRWTEYCVLSAADVGNVKSRDSNNIIFTMKDTNVYATVVTLSATDNQKLSKRLSNGFERSFYWNDYKTKRENKNRTNEFRCFLKPKFVWVNNFFL